MSTQVRELLQELCGKVSAYEHAYGQAREEALADYGNTFSKVAAQLSVITPSSQPVAVRESADHEAAVNEAFNKGFAAGKLETQRHLVKAAKALLKAAK